MTTPFKAVSSGVKDAYNFYQSQLRINIECAFGVLVHRWGVLRSPLPMNISLKKTTSLVRALCCVHNWLIDQNEVNDLPQPSVKDRLSIKSRGGDIICNDQTPVTRLLGGGEHYDDFSAANHRAKSRSLFSSFPKGQHPREYLLHKLILLGITERPQPMGSTTTGNN